MQFEATTLPGVYLLTPKVFGDERGFFMETWNADVFRNADFDLHFVQDNHSRSAQGILRGLHYQTRHTQGKLVRVTAGSVYDVAVDMRKDSPTLGQWFGVTLNDKARQMLWVPPGFGHGFVVLSESADLVYFVSGSEYRPDLDRGVRWNDPALGIEWPIDEPLLSQRDLDARPLAELADQFPSY